jgi:hypothetical protein
MRQRPGGGCRHGDKITLERAVCLTDFAIYVTYFG